LDFGPLVVFLAYRGSSQPDGQPPVETGETVGVGEPPKVGTTEVGSDEDGWTEGKAIDGKSEGQGFTDPEGLGIPLGVGCVKPPGFWIDGSPRSCNIILISC
jgi:hypothetical protein